MLFQKIRSADYSLDDYIWEHVSADAKDCVKKLLTVRLAEYRFVSNFISRLLRSSESFRFCLHS